MSEVNMSPEELNTFLNQCLQIPALRRKVFNKAREEKLTLGGHYYTEYDATIFMRPIADHMIKTQKDVKLLYEDYRHMMGAGTLYNKVNQTAKYLKDFGEPEYVKWRDGIRIEKDGDGIYLRHFKIRPGNDAPIFHEIDEKERQNDWKDLYEWIETGDKSDKLFHRTNLKLSPEDMQSLNNLFKSLPEFTARIKHDEIKVIREKIE
jgi:hypothetical protein